MKTKLLIVNTSANMGSTGRIAENIGLMSENSGFSVRFAYGRKDVNSRVPLLKIGTNRSICWHGIKTRLFDAHGFATRQATKEFIRELEIWKPDIVNIHNLHGYYIHVGEFFNYLKRVQIPIVWTLHDCWSFTGHCSYFDEYNCFKWETECFNCPGINSYPKSLLIDKSRKNFNRKKQIFNGLENLTIVTPSKWLAQNVKNSFLKEYPVRVITNGLNIEKFQVIEDMGIFEKYGINSKNFILGVANVWEKRKGLDDFLAIRKELPSVQIVLVGLSAKQVFDLPKDIVAISRTEDITELAKLYSSASVYVNPTYMDNFPTTNIESLSCGTPVVTYRTGGSPESIDNETGFVVEKGDIKRLKIAIENVIDKGKDFYRENCRKRAIDFYNKEDRFNEYIDLFIKLTKQNI